MTDADRARLVDLDLLISSLRGEARIADRPGQHDRLNAAADVVVCAVEYIQHLTAERDALAAQLDAQAALSPLRIEYGLVWDDLGSADTFPTLKQARAAARGFDEPAQVVRIETWPVADEVAS